MSLCTKCKQKMPNILSLMKKNKQQALRKKKHFKTNKIDYINNKDFLFYTNVWTLHEYY